MRANSFVQISITSLTGTPNSAYALPLWGLEALLQLDDGVLVQRLCLRVVASLKLTHTVMVKLK